LNLERISKVTNVPLVLIRPNWYGRVTEGEAVTYVHAPNRRRLMGPDRAPLAEAAAAPVQTHGATSRRRPRRVDGHPVHLAQWHPVANAAEGNGLRIRQHVLAATRPLAAGRRLASPACAAARRVAPARPARSGPRHRRQRLGASATRGKKTG